MKRILTSGTLIALLLSIPLLMAGQNTLKLRIGGTSTRFMSEPQGDEILHPDVLALTNPASPFSDFKSTALLGLDAELMLSLTDKVWIGLEVSGDRLYGVNSYAGFYNFQYSPLFQLITTNTATSLQTYHINNVFPLEYNTSLINVVPTFRIYPAPDGRFRPFIKVNAGLSLVSTELAIQDKEAWDAYFIESTPTDDPIDPVLYSRGTSGASKGRMPALLIGGGIGFEFQLNDKFSLYADGAYRLINSDIVDGRPNFDWEADPDWVEDPTYEWIPGLPDDRGELIPFNTRATIGKLTFGIVYTLGDKLSVTGGGGSSSGKKIGGGTSRTKPHLPFFKLKRL